MKTSLSMSVAVLLLISAAPSARAWIVVQGAPAAAASAPNPAPAPAAPVSPPADAPAPVAEPPAPPPQPQPQPTAPPDKEAPPPLPPPADAPPSPLQAAASAYPPPAATAAQGGGPGPVERLPPSAYPEEYTRGLYGGSMWMTFHGAQWPYYPRSGIGIYDIQELRKHARRDGISIAVIAVPASAAQKVTDQVVSAGIKAVLSFSPGALKVPADVKMKSVDLTVSLESLSFYLAHGDVEGEEE